MLHNSLGRTLAWDMRWRAIQTVSGQIVALGSWNCCPDLCRRDSQAGARSLRWIEQDETFRRLVVAAEFEWDEKFAIGTFQRR
jgi:hypothetical protein